MPVLRNERERHVASRAKTGFLNVEEEGEHALGVMIAMSRSHSQCGAFASVEGQEIFKIPTVDLKGSDEFVPVRHNARRQPGLYELKFWIACGRGNRVFPEIKLIHRKPSYSAPGLLDIADVGHRVHRIWIRDRCRDLKPPDAGAHRYECQYRGVGTDNRAGDLLGPASTACNNVDDAAGYPAAISQDA